MSAARHIRIHVGGQTASVAIDASMAYQAWRPLCYNMAPSMGALNAESPEKAEIKNTRKQFGRNGSVFVLDLANMLTEFSN